MDKADRLNFSLDRPARLLITTLWIAPVAIPVALVGYFGWRGDVEPRRALPAAILRPALPIIEEKIAAAPVAPAPVEITRQMPAAPEPAATRVALSGTHVLREVVVREDMTLASGGVTIALAGIVPPPAGSECKRLDGVAETCAKRAAARLEILTRGRAVTCDLKEKSGADLLGLCRVGKIDLADDLLRNGLAMRVAR